jgi:glycosyltransferase involved in cell wall biosynthesis
MTVHSVDPFVLPPEMFPSYYTTLFKSIRILAKKIEMFIAPSDTTKRHLVGFLGVSEEKVKAIYNGIDLKKFKPVKITSKIRDELRLKYHIFGPYVLHVSSCAPVKNVPSLIEAFWKVKKLGLKHMLVICGSEGQKFNGILRRFSLEDQVIFTGYISNDDELAKLYNAADLFVLPSLHESCPYPLLEAMACGTPILASNVFSIPEIVGDAAILFNPYDKEEIANSIYTCLVDKQLRIDLSKKGLRRAKAFNIEDFIKKHLEVYNIVQK